MREWMVVGLVLGGCAHGAPTNGDSDGDGLSDAKEKQLGTDPHDADTDHDGLSDPDELDAGTDPTLADSDGDTYLDGDELQEGHDPLDPDDRIYEGYWPYNRHKGDLVDPGFDGQPLRVGDVFGELKSKDQLGQAVDLYDWGGSDKLTIVEASATWCYPCQVLSDFLAGHHDDYEFYKLYGDMLTTLDDGGFRWVTILSDDGSRGSTEQDVTRWADQFPNDKIAVLTDPDGVIRAAMNDDTEYGGGSVSSFPMCVVVDGDMVVQYRDLCWDAMDFVLENLSR